MEDALGDAGDFDSLKDNFDRLKEGSEGGTEAFGESLLE